MTVTDMNAYRGGRRRIGSILVTVGLVMAGCASSGDVEQVRQERAQAKAKMSAELQQERTLAQSMEKDSEARKAEADKLAKALGGKQSQAGPKLQLAATSISLTAALQDQKCQVKYRTGPSSDAWGLYIAPNTPCSNVTVGAADATFTALSPLRPVVVEHGGTLTLLDQTMTLYASSFLIWRGGIMQAGTAATPIQNQITIVMAGNSSPSPAPTATGGASIVTISNNAPNARDLTVMDGGTLALYGAKGLSATPGTLNKDIVSGTKSWTYLAVPAGPATYNDAENVSAPVPTTNPATTLTLARQVDWQVNDWISVATTSFSSHQTEIVQICGLSSVANPDPQASTLGLPANVSQLTLCQNLKHYHYGGLTPTPGFFPVGTKQVVAKGGTAIDVGRQAKSFYDDHTRNYGIDERAEVALLSRNIKLTSVAGSAGDQQLFQNTATYPLSYDMGGHVVAMVTGTTYPTLQLVGVEIEKFGQGLTGRYPVHLHMLQNLPAGNVLVQDVSVHHSYNKCYVPHQTPNAKFYNNVCVRTVGQGFYLEDGDHITGNQFMRNHVAGTMAALSTYSFPRQNGSLYWDGDNLQIQHSHVQNGAITGATKASPIVVATNAPGPSTGTQVTVSGVLGNTAANGTWTVANANPAAGTFALQGSTGNGTFIPAAGSWTISGLNQITGLATDPTTSLIIVKTQSLPGTGDQVTIAGTNVVDGVWTVTSPTIGAQGPQFLLAGSQSKSSGSYSCCNGTWTTSGSISNASNARPIVITSSSSLGSGAQVTISGVPGNTAANGTFTVTNVDSTHFSLNGSAGNGNYTKAIWAETNPRPNWYNVNNIPDTAQSNANANALDSTHPGGFWITNLGNTFVNNSVAGCQGPGRGYWLLAQGSTTTGYPEFTGNRVHGCYNGIDNDDTTGNTVQPYPMLSSTAQYAPVLLLSDNTITRSRNKAAWFRNWYATLHNHRFATNLRGFSLLVGGGPEGTFPGFWGLVYQNVIAGMTRNNVERYPACASAGWQTECTDVGVFSFENYPAHNVNIQGYSYYDGPARIEHNRFVNFRFDPTGIHQTDRAARLLTKTDIQHISTTAGMVGQLQGIVTQAAANAAPSSNYQGYPGDVANGWQTSNAQTVPPTQYISDSIWDNVDFKHQVYTEAVNMGPFLDGDKTTVIRDLDSHLTGLRVVDGGGNSHSDVVPISLNSVDYFATEYTVDEPHSRGPNDFRSTSLMSPHKYATLNVESVTSPAGGIPTPFHVVAQRDMPAYGDTVYPSLFLYGRGKNPIYEPFMMDRMGYMVYGVQGIEHDPPYTPTAFQNRLLFSYTDPPVHKAGEYFVNRIAVYQQVSTPANIKVYRIRRQWGGQLYGQAQYPPSFHPPVGASCDHTFFDRQSDKETKWTDCINRAKNVSPYTGGVTLTAASDWKSFDQSYKDLLSGKTSVATFIVNQPFYYDSTNNLLYFYMIEDKPVQKQYSPYGTCDAANYKTGNNYLAQTQQIKPFSDPNSVQAALDASCLVSGGTPQHNDLFVCHETGCAAYLVDLSAATTTTPTQLPPATPPKPITRTDYKAWNQYYFVYGTPAQEPNGVPVPTTAPQDGTPLPAFLAPTDSLPPNQGGNQITYDFYPLSGGPNGGAPFPVTENFRYHCVTNPPWSAVNPRGGYPPAGGFTYPLGPSVCMTAAQGAAVMEAGAVLQVTVTSPGSGYTSTPTVTITPPNRGMPATAIATIANGSVTGVTMTNQGSGYDFGPQVTFSPPSP